MLTTLCASLVGTALFDRRALSWDAAEGVARRPPEAVTYVDVAPPLAEPTPTPAGARSGAPALPPLVAPTRPAAPALPAPRARSGLPPVATSRDSSVGTARGAAPARVPPAALPRGPAFPVTPRVERAPTATCAAPCSGALSSGARLPAPPLDSAARAQRLREIGESVPALAARRPRGDVVGAPGGPPGDRTRPQAAGGVSIPIGLPGGGPSAAERRRNRELDAQITGSLARVRARLDSLHADSVRKADSARKAREKPPR